MPSIRRVKLACFDRHEQRSRFTSIDELSHHIVEQLSKEPGPVALYGHSMGAIVAYQVACKLSRSTTRVARLIVSGRRAPQLPARLAPIHCLSDDAFLQELIAYGGVSEAISKSRRLVRDLLPIIRSDLAVAQTYQFQPGQSLECPISAIYTYEDPVVRSEEISAWQERTSSEFSLHQLNGGHFFHAARPPALIDIIQRSLGASRIGRDG